MYFFERKRRVTLIAKILHHGILLIFNSILKTTNTPYNERTIIYRNLKKSFTTHLLLYLKQVSEADNALTQAEFESVGKRKDYTFRLEIQDGIVMNYIDGSAVSRDLAEVFLTNPEAVELSNRYRVILRFLQNFELKGNLETRK